MSKTKEPKLNAPRSVSPGDQYNKLIAVERLPEKMRKEEAWLCKCDCGNETVATKDQLLSGRKKSCGCLKKQTPKNALDLSGQRFGKLTIIKRDGATASGSAVWLCRCDCGGEIKTNATTLRRGEAVTCGCGRVDQAESARKVLQEEHTVDGVQVPLLTKKVRSDSRTGYKGIHKRVRKGKEAYEVSISIKGKRMYGGRYSDLQDAISARRRLEEKYHRPYIEVLEERKNEQQ